MPSHPAQHPHRGWARIDQRERHSLAATRRCRGPLCPSRITTARRQRRTWHGPVQPAKCRSSSRSSSVAGGRRALQDTRLMLAIRLEGRRPRVRHRRPWIAGGSFRRRHGRQVSECVGQPHALRRVVLDRSMVRRSCQARALRQLGVWCPAHARASDATILSIGGHLGRCAALLGRVLLAGRELGPTSRRGLAGQASQGQQQVCRFPGTRGSTGQRQPTR